jgi:hypothetical protein
MAEQVKDFDWDSKPGDKYPYLDWFNGDTWKLEIGKDFNCPLHSMRAQLYNKARSMGIKVRTHVPNPEFVGRSSFIYVQAVEELEDA